MQQLKYTEPTEEASAVPETAKETEIFVMLPMVRVSQLDIHVRHCQQHAIEHPGAVLVTCALSKDS